MKKLIALFFSLIISNFVLFSQIDEKFILDNIDIRFVGAYLPVEFLTTLDETKHYATAMKYNMGYTDYKNIFYEHLIVYENKIIFFELYADVSRKVSKYKLPYYQFDYINDNRIIITDPNGNQYLKMTDDLINYRKIIGNYIGRVILHDLIQNNIIIIDDDIITIPSFNNKQYRIGTLGFLYPEHCNLYLIDLDTRSYVHLEIDNNIFTIYETGWFERNNRNRVRRILWRKEL